MKKLFLALIFAALPMLSFAAEYGGPELEKVDIDVYDKVRPCRMAHVHSPTIAWVATVPSSSAMSALQMTQSVPHDLMLSKLVFTGAKIEATT